MFICDQEIKDVLEQWAEAEGRTLSNLVERIAQNAVAQYQKTNSRSFSRPKNLGIDADDGTVSAFFELLDTSQRPSDSEIIQAAKESGVSVDALLKLRDRLFDDKEN